MEIDESLVFPIKLDLPGCLHVAGCDWFCRPEFHVTTFTPRDLAEALAVDVEALLHAGEQRREELTRRRVSGLTGALARVHAEDGRQTLVAFCDVAGLDDVLEPPDIL
jgi:hypothetical protein